MNTDYDLIDKLLVSLLNQLNSVFSDLEILEIREFIDVGEYGIAVETVTDIIREGQKKIAPEALSIIGELVDVMELDKDAFYEDLRGNVAE